MGNKHAPSKLPPPSPVLHVESIRGSKCSLSIISRYHVGRRLEQDYHLEKKVLGTGVNGPVRLATNGSTKYAVKSFRRVGMSPAERSGMRNEVEVFLHLDHPHIATLEDVYETAEDLHLVMEYMAGGELYDRLSERVRYSEIDAARTARQMLLAVAYLHANGVVHRDLKLENFLYEKKGGEDLKLIDFGFAKFWDSSLAAMSRPCGTMHYVAPEVLAQSYTEKADMWSLGIIVYMLLMGTPPFHGSSKEVLRQIAVGKLTIRNRQAFGSLSDEARDFVFGLLTTDPKRRPSAAEALQHSWTLETDQRQNAALGLDVLQSLRRFAHASHFRRACLSMMAWSLTADDRRQLRDQFQAIDVDCSGTISLSEFAKVLESNFSIDSTEAETLFTGLGVDGSSDHEICYHEFLAASLQNRVRLHEDVLRTTFKRFDVKHTGLITADSLRQLLGDSFEGCDIQMLFQEADVSGKGAIGYDEFLSYFQQDELQFESLDADASRPRSGSVNSESMAEMAGCLLDRALASPSQPRPLPSPLAKRKRVVDSLAAASSSTATANRVNSCCGTGGSSRRTNPGGVTTSVATGSDETMTPQSSQGQNQKLQDGQTGRRRRRWKQCFARACWKDSSQPLASPAA